MVDSARAKPNLIVHSAHPFNAEPPPARLCASFLTPCGDFYVRSHGTIPDIDPAAFRLRVDGLVRAPLELSLAELRRRFPERAVTAVMQCAGNRRADLLPVRPVTGDPWQVGAIGNAAWAGVALADVLRAAGANEGPGLHVAFAAADEVQMEGPSFTYGASIPISKALAPEVLLVWAMNGEPLSPEHGFPLRVVVPGFAGVRSPKWLVGITVQDRPSANHMQQRDYKLFPPDVTGETAAWATGVTIYGMPLTSAICEPARNAALPAGPVTVRGYAIATAREIVRVDVSADGGRSWRQAALEPHPEAPWSWTLWQAGLDLPQGEHELVVRAWDSAGQTQPSLLDDVWNFKGYLAAAWHRVRVRVG